MVTLASNASKKGAGIDVVVLLTFFEHPERVASARTHAARIQRFVNDAHEVDENDGAEQEDLVDRGEPAARISENATHSRA